MGRHRIIPTKAQLMELLNAMYTCGWTCEASGQQPYYEIAARLGVPSVLILSMVQWALPKKRGDGTELSKYLQKKGAELILAKHYQEEKPETPAVIEPQSSMEVVKVENQYEELQPGDVYINGSTPVTDSRTVAHVFGKEHRNVLDSIRKIISGAAYFSAAEKHFSLSNYYNEQGQKQPMYVMDKDGFTLLAMGFSGEKAMEFKLKYIEKFNEMEKKLRPNGMTMTEIVAANANRLVEMERKQLRHQAELNDHSVRIETVEHKVDENSHKIDHISSMLNDGTYNDDTITAQILGYRSAQAFHKAYKELGVLKVDEREGYPKWMLTSKYYEELKPYSRYLPAKNTNHEVITTKDGVIIQRLQFNSEGVERLRNIRSKLTGEIQWNNQ